MNEMQRQGVTAGVLAVACWAGFILVSRHGGQGVLLPADIIALRFMVGAALLLPFARVRMMWSLKGLTLALVGGIGYCLLVYQGFRHTSAAHAAVMLPGAIPFAAALFSFVLLGETPSRYRAGGLLLIACGIAVMAFSAGGSASLTGDLWLLAAVLAWALYTVLIRRWQVAPLTGAVTTAVYSAALYLPVYWLLLPRQLHAAPVQEWLLQGFYQGFIATVVAMLLYLRAVSRIGPAGMGALMALVPVVSGLAAVPVLSESLTLVELLALLVTSVGALLAAGVISGRRVQPAT